MKQSKLLVWACGVITALWLALAPLAAAQFDDFGGGWGFGGWGFGEEEVEEVEEEEEPKFAPDGIPLGYDLVAENSGLELFIDAENAQLIVRDKATKYIWRTNPEFDEENSMVAELWLKHMNSQLIIEYTDMKRRTAKTTNNVNEQAVITYEPIPKGVRVVFDMQALGFIVPVEYRLGEGYLEARIPDEGIQENGEFLLVTLDLVPFFGAAMNTEEGYMLIPDGPGAIVEFKENNPSYNRSFQEMAYGPNSRALSANIWEHTLSMVSGKRPVPGPYFGLKSGNQAFLGLATDGEFDVQITASPPGIVMGIDMYRASAQFQLRKRYTARLSRSRSVESIESKRIDTDRAVRFYLLKDEDASYVGMANVYRDYLKQKYNVVGRLNMDENDVAPLHLRIMCGALKDGMVFDTLVDMTTFKEAQTIVERLLAMGITNMDVTLVGWMKNGVDGILPRHWPPESILGGTDGLKQFISWAKSKNINVYLEDVFHNAEQKNGGFSTATDVVRDASKQPIGRGNSFMLSPLALYSKFVPKALPNFEELGVHGLNLKNWSTTLPYDRNPYYEGERKDSAMARLAIARMIQQKLGGVIVQGSNLYFLAVTDAIYDAPVDPSTHVFIDYAVPFFQIVVHGLVPCYGYPGNLRNDPRREFLRMIEWGSLPTFELTYDNSSRLRDVPVYFSLFSSQFEDWLDVVKEEYDAVNVKMGWLQRLTIVDHGRLDDEVFQTTYEDGTRVIVNYRDKAFTTADQITVPALDYRVIEGGKGN